MFGEPRDFWREFRAARMERRIQLRPSSIKSSAGALVVTIGRPHARASCYRRQPSTIDGRTSTSHWRINPKTSSCGPGRLVAKMARTVGDKTPAGRRARPSSVQRRYARNLHRSEEISETFALGQRTGEQHLERFSFSCGGEVSCGGSSAPVIKLCHDARFVQARVVRQ